MRSPSTTPKSARQIAFLTQQIPQPNFAFILQYPDNGFPLKFSSENDPQGFNIISFNN